MRTLLVTVGSTKFDELIRVIERHQVNFKDFIKKFRIERVIIQHGKSPAPKMVNFDNIQIVDYLKPEVMSKLLCESTVIISHGGAGTIFEVLRGNKSNLEMFLVVENENLMDAHQSELIESLIAINCPIQRGDLKNLFGITDNKSSSVNLPEPNYSQLVKIIKSNLQK